MDTVTLLKNLNYLNTREIYAFCKKAGIPYVILVEKKNGKLVQSKDKDRKGMVLDRVRRFLKTGKVPGPTIYSRKVCSELPLSPIDASTRLRYGQYDKSNPKLISVLKKLTHGQFKDGFIARELMRDLWTAGKVPTLKQFATAWLKAVKNYQKDHEEWAFLTDRSKGTEMSDWKKKRDQIAKAVLSELSVRMNHV